MSRLSKSDPTIIAEVREALMDHGLVAELVTGPSALTADSGGVALNYTTDDPAITGDNAVTIANGSAVDPSENIEAAEELDQVLAAIDVDAELIRTALDTAISSGADNSTAPAALTLSLTPITWTYTANDPSITADAAVTVDDGDAMDDDEMHEYLFEANVELAAVASDWSRAHAAITTLINSGVSKAPVLVARTSTNGGVAITYGTDDPGYAPAGAYTIADGDTLTSAENAELMEEINEQLDLAGDGFTLIKTAYDAYLSAAGRPTS